MKDQVKSHVHYQSQEVFLPHEYLTFHIICAAIVLRLRYLRFRKNLYPSSPSSQIRQQSPRSMPSVDYEIVSASASRLIVVVPCDKGYISSI